MNGDGHEKLLELIDVASPCPVDWATMSGDETRRFCSQCKLHVYNLSEMTEEKAERFLRQRIAKENPACIRFFRRADGTILTRDCHTIRMQYRRVLSFWHRLTAVSASFLLAAASSFADEAKNAEPRGEPRTKEHDWPLLRCAASESLIEAAKEFDRGHFALALDLLDKLELRDTAEIAQCHYFRGLCLQALHLFDESEQEYDWVLKNSKDPILRDKALDGKRQLAIGSSVITRNQLTSPMEVTTPKSNLFPVTQGFMYIPKAMPAKSNPEQTGHVQPAPASTSEKHSGMQPQDDTNFLIDWGHKVPKSP